MKQLKAYRKYIYWCGKSIYDSSWLPAPFPDFYLSLPFCYQFFLIQPRCFDSNYFPANSFNSFVPLWSLQSRNWMSSTTCQFFHFNVILSSLKIVQQSSNMSIISLPHSPQHTAFILLKPFNPHQVIWRLSSFPHSWPQLTIAAFWKHLSLGLWHKPFPGFPSPILVDHFLSSVLPDI